MRTQSDDGGCCRRAHGDARIGFRDTMGTEIIVIFHVEGCTERGKTVDEHIVRSFRDSCGRRTRRSGNANGVWPEAAGDRFNGIVHGGLHDRAVEETGSAGVRWNAYDGLYSDRIPVGYGVG